MNMDDKKVDDKVKQALDMVVTINNAYFTKDVELARVYGSLDKLKELNKHVCERRVAERNLLITYSEICSLHKELPQKLRT